MGTKDIIEEGPTSFERQRYYSFSGGFNSLNGGWLRFPAISRNTLSYLNMSSNVEKGYRLLRNDDLSDDKELAIQYQDARPQSPKKSTLKHYVCSGLFIISVITNALLLAIILLDSNLRIRLLQTCQAHSSNKSPYTNLSPDPTVPFPYSTGYGPAEATNHTHADELWESISIDAGVVALPHTWAAQHNLAPTQPFPWDSSKGVYVINAFHTIHCLKNLHRLVYEAHHGWPLTRSVPHALHCLDHMRKDTMCLADDFMLATPPERYENPGPRGQARICRSWDGLVEWAGRHAACYRHVTDREEEFAEGHEEVERYLYCPRDSLYYQKAVEYREALGKGGEGEVV